MISFCDQNCTVALLLNFKIASMSSNIISILAVRQVLLYQYIVIKGWILLTTEKEVWPFTDQSCGTAA